MTSRMMKNEDHLDLFKLIKKSFAAGTNLNRELKLYESVLSREEGIDKILNEAVRQFQLINKKVVFDEQEALLNALDEKVLHRNIPNYKNLATLYQIFNRHLSPKERVLLEKEYLDGLSEVKEKNNVMNVGNLEFNLFVKKFNEKYNELIKENKELLSKFISEGGSVEFKIYLNELLCKIKNEIHLLSENKENELIKEKLIGTFELLENFKKRNFDDEVFLTIMKVQNLISEMKRNVN